MCIFLTCVEESGYYIYINTGHRQENMHSRDVIKQYRRGGALEASRTDTSASLLRRDRLLSAWFQRHRSQAVSGGGENGIRHRGSHSDDRRFARAS